MNDDATCDQTRPEAATGGELAAVLFDMDGTLLDTEKVWTVSLDMLAGHLGGQLSRAAREDMVGSSQQRSVRLMHADLGLPADAPALADSARFLTEATAELLANDLVWKPGAEDLLLAVRAAGVPTALVTATQRSLTDICLRTIGPERFDVTVCGDEVDAPKPAPDPYLRAAALLGVDPGRCLVIEDSPNGIESAQAAGCAVLAVPSEVPISPDPRRTVVSTLVGLDVAALRALAGSSVR